MKQIIVGMSGGVDSFVTALLLKAEGYEVIGITLNLWETPKISDLPVWCGDLGISWQLWEGRELFREKVVHPFIKEYLNGRTPSPCCICNNQVKWKLLAAAADTLGVEKIATGHYVRIRKTGNTWYIFKGKDPVKDQSYFLWGLPQEILKRTVTPLGDYTKAEVKAYAGTRGFVSLAKKRESMGICFLEGKDYRDFILQQEAVQLREGNIIDEQGNVMGRHPGILNYTIGQKRGLPFAEETLYVSKIEAGTNSIQVSPREGLYSRVLEISQVNFFNPEDVQAADIEVKVRGLGLNPQGYVRMEKREEGKWYIHLASPAWAVAPGQPVALYRGECLVGGGMVEHAFSL